MADSGFYTYMLECGDGTFYTGWTTDVEKRLAVHNLGKGAKYTRARRPVKLLGSWQFETKSDAMKFECWLKTQPRQAKASYLTKYPNGKAGEFQ